MSNTRNFPAFGISLVVHSLLLIAMWTIKHNLSEDRPEIAVESIFSEEREQQEFDRELEIDTEVAETMNTVAGGMVSADVGAANNPPSQTVKIEESESLKDPEIKVNIGDITMPGDNLLSMELGDTEVKGEGGAFVDGYGTALGQITQELIRMMRQQKVMVVWLFDKSESMKDDQAEIRDNFHKVYEELRIVTQKESDLKRRGDDILLTSIWAFGEKWHPLTSEPTSDVEKIRSTIDEVPIDPSGIENTCHAISAVLDKYSRMAARQKRKLAIVIVTDESGDDGEMVEETLAKAQRANAPLYFLGREAIFGYPYARIRWKDPKYGLTHWVRIDRGPETAFNECLQWDGLHERWDSFSSGFGPYTQVRLAKETGGIFFALPSEEENLGGRGASLQRRFDALDMKEYEPLLVSRREYQDHVNPSKFRKTILEVIRLLNPREDRQLRIRSRHYPLEAAKFQEEAAEQVQKAARAMSVLSQVIPMMEKLKPLRDEEESERWRAHFDLIVAQLYCYRVRLFQYLLAMDDHVHQRPQPENKGKNKSNEWNVHRVKKMLEPDDAQFERIKRAFNVQVSKEEYLEKLQQQEDKSRELFQFVIETHPGTPWAIRAKDELNRGFGMEFRDRWRDPNYEKDDIEIPNF